MLKARGLSSSPWWEHTITLNLVLERRMRNGVCWDEMASTQGSRLEAAAAGRKEENGPGGPAGQAEHRSGCWGRSHLAKSRIPRETSIAGRVASPRAGPSEKCHGLWESVPKGHAAGSSHVQLWPGFCGDLALEVGRRSEERFGFPQREDSPRGFQCDGKGVGVGRLFWFSADALFVGETVAGLAREQE